MDVMVMKGNMMNDQMKAALDSYLRNLLGVVLALVTTTMANAGVASPLDFTVAEWLTVANGLWAAAVPTVIRWVNKKDPAFGLVAQAAAVAVSTKIQEESKKATAAKKPATKKPATKK